MADLSPIHEGLGPVPCGAPLTARLSQLFSFVRVEWIRTATSLKAWFLPPSLLPPWSSSIRWVIPCSHVRVFARRLGR